MVVDECAPCVGALHRASFSVGFGVVDPQDVMKGNATCCRGTFSILTLSGDQIEVMDDGPGRSMARFAESAGHHDISVAWNAYLTEIVLQLMIR